MLLLIDMLRQQIGAIQLARTVRSRPSYGILGLALAILIILLDHPVDAQRLDSAADYRHSMVRARVRRDGVGICVALSGGGLRASAFHAGVLAELSKLISSSSSLLSSQRSGIPLFAPAVSLDDGIDVLSAVSGGSITASLFALTTPAHWEDEGIPRLKAFVARRPVAATVRGWAAGFFFSGTQRLEAFEKVLDEFLFRKATLPRFGDAPYVVILAKNFNNGHLIRFSPLSMHDYPDLPIARVVAASCAVPMVFDPLVINKLYIHSDYAGSAPQVRGERAVLFDGGIHDNLALEPVIEWAAVSQNETFPSHLCDIVFSSDATESLFDVESADLNSIPQAGWRGLALLMSRVTDLQSHILNASPSLNRRVFRISMPKRFNRLSATLDLALSDFDELVRAGRDEAIATVGTGERLRQLLVEARRGNGGNPP